MARARKRAAAASLVRRLAATQLLGLLKMAHPSRQLGLTSSPVRPHDLHDDFLIVAGAIVMMHVAAWNMKPPALMPTIFQVPTSPSPVPALDDGDPAIAVVIVRLLV
jgi:hypothetical protein